MIKTAERAINGVNRINKILSYIHDHLHQTLSLDQLAKHSCWSRWQLQRVFQAETGLSVATYVRELKLSFAAERLIDSSERVIDIAFTFGFTSEVAFSRAFKQMFGVSPRSYRKLGQRTGLRKPIVNLPPNAQSTNFVEVKVETKEGFVLKGVHDQIRGLFATEPDFQQKVPLLWQQLEKAMYKAGDNKWPYMGVVDVTQSEWAGSQIQYWAGMAVEVLPSQPSVLDAFSSLDTLSVPRQTYAVISHRGPIALLPKTLEWFLLHWLPSSGYCGVEGYELECYPLAYQSCSPQAVMQYWVPIA